MENFIALANDGYYDGLPFHRVIPNFIVQTGDATGTGAGGTTCWGGIPFPVELSAQLHHFSGALAMAHMGSDLGANFSQFYAVQTLPASISKQDAELLIERGMQQEVADAYREAGGAPYLDMRNTVFGQIYEGMEVLDKVAAASQGDNDGVPLSPVTLYAVQISAYGRPDPEPPVIPESEGADK